MARNTSSPESHPSGSTPDQTPATSPEVITNEYTTPREAVESFMKRLEAAYGADKSLGPDQQDWADANNGVDGGAAFESLIGRVQNPNYQLKEYESIFLDYMGAVVQLTEARAGIDAEALVAAHPGMTPNEAREAEIPTLTQFVENKIINAEQKRAAEIDSGKAPTSAAVKKQDSRINANKGILTNIEKVKAFAEEPLNYNRIGDQLAVGTWFMEAAQEAENSTMNQPEAKKYEKAKKALEKQIGLIRAETVFNQQLAAVNNGQYKNQEFTPPRVTSRAIKIGTAPTPVPSPVSTPVPTSPPAPEATPPSSTPEQTPEKPAVSQEYIDAEAKLASLRFNLAEVQAELTKGFNPFRRAELKEKAAQLHREFAKQVKLVSLLEASQDLRLQDSSNIAESIAQYAESKTAMRYEELAGTTKGMQHSGGMEFAQKHGTKAILAATALGAFFGFGLGGAATGAAVGVGLKVAGKMHKAWKGKALSNLGNVKRTNAAGKETYVNNELRLAALNKLVDENGQLRFKLNIKPDASDEVKMKKAARFTQGLLEKAFDGATGMAHEKMENAVRREYTKGYLGAIGVGAAAGAVTYMGGHMIGNMLHYQAFGGDHSIRSGLDRLGGAPDPHYYIRGYTPTGDSLARALVSNFKPFSWM